MAGAATILFAREDFSMPGAADPAATGALGASAAETCFFGLLRTTKPDVVVLDLSRANGNGVDTILKIRRNSSTPILVVCDTNDPASREYRIAGAAECITAPVDILLLNETLQQIIRINHQGQPPRRVAAPEVLQFAGVTFFPHDNVLSRGAGSRTKLTTSESRLLVYFASEPWTVRTRAEVGEMLYGRHRPISDRAIDVIVNRLRKKLVLICGPMGQNLIKTEFRRGYMFNADVSTAAIPEVVPAASYG